MLGNRGWALVIGLAVLVLVLPGSGVLTAGVPAAAGSPSSMIRSPASVALSSLPSNGLPAKTVSQIESRSAAVARAEGGSRAAGLEPNLAYRSVREGSAIVPANLATGAVAPGPTSIGVNDLGLRANSAGGLVPYSYRTTSLDGSVTLNNISLLPVETNASDAITIQENAVLNNVTLFGNSSYAYWMQNVIFYSIAGDQLQLLTDAWNFSSPTSEFLQNNIYQNSPGGFVFYGTYVHQVPLAPPAFIVHLPFTIRLYLNATNIGGRNAIFFNYTLYSGSDIYLDHQNLGRAINGGSFDWIIFNSTAGRPKGYSAPASSFLISGSQSTGLGLANDAEIAVCGPSDGFSSDIRTLSATASLLYLNGTTGSYSAVPAAFTTTEDTGESVEGVDAHFTAATAADGTALLTNGPEFIYGLWNATGSRVSEQRFTVDATPSSALIWVSPRSGRAMDGFSNASAAWALGSGADVTFWLPSGPGDHYAVAVLANDYAPQYAPISPGPARHVALALDRSLGVYVPILAFGNAGVAAIASSGDGSAANPYVIDYAQHQPISSLFGTYDEFTEPLYPGMLLSGVTAHVLIVHPPSLYIQYTASDLFFLEVYWGLNPPGYNYLPMEVYDSSNVSIIGAPMISGWFPVTLTGFLLASLVLSNDTHCLVAYSQFSSMGSSMAIVEPAGNATAEQNTVFGNRFVVNPVVHSTMGLSLYQVRAFNTTTPGPVATGALGVFAEGNTIYNNLFDTPITAYSTPQNPFLAYVFVNDLGYRDFAQVATNWHNAWNISREPADYTQIVNGVPLFGNIVGASFMGGNSWANWNGTVPYTDNGFIVGGGDYLPLPP
jgi:thermopsin